MAETIKIGGELESVATGGIVAAASAIKDKTKNRTQEQINAETDETLAAHSSAISGFEGGNFVTLVATDADADIAAVFTRLSVTPAVNIIYRIANWKHDATTKYNTAYYSEYAANGTTTADLVPISVENKGIDDVPTAESENLIKSGGVQNELALGAVYDVSAKNPTAGPNNDGKFTLEYILDQNNVNTLIPIAYRKGGMSIKFVHSSDNNYIQARLMANAFTVDVTKWQCSTSEIKNGSKDLIESGAVASKVGEITEQTYTSDELAGFAWDTSTHEFKNFSSIDSVVVQLNADSIYKATLCTKVYLFSEKPVLNAVAEKIADYNNGQIFYVQTQCYALIQVSTSDYIPCNLYIKSAMEKKISVLNESVHKNILFTFATLRDITTNDITFTWSDECNFHMSGTTDTYINNSLYNGTLPTVLQVGKKYGVKFISTQANIIVRITLSNGDEELVRYDISGVKNITIPANADKLDIKIRKNGTGSLAINADVTFMIFDGLSVDAIDEEKQDKLTAGSNITIENNVISAGFPSIEPVMTNNYTTFPMVGGWIRSSDGAYRTSLSDSYCASDFIEIPNDIDIMFCNANARKNGGVWCMYDSSKNYISDAYGDTHMIKPVSGAKYIRVTHNGTFDGTYPDRTIWWIRLSTDNQPENALISKLYPLRGKVLAFAGDSITYGYDDNNDGCQLPNPWVNQVGNFLKTTALNYGMSSASLMEAPSGFTETRQSILTEYVNYVDDIDIIGFMIGINDWIRNYPFGTISDNTNTTFLGCMNLLCQGIVNKWKPSDGKRVFICTYAHDDQTSPSNVTWNEWNEGIKAVAAKYSIPVCDTYNDVGICVENDAEGIYWKMNTTSHSAHFTQAGANVFATFITNFIFAKFGKI